MKAFIFGLVFLASLSAYADAHYAFVDECLAVAKKTISKKADAAGLTLESLDNGVGMQEVLDAPYHPVKYIAFMAGAYDRQGRRTHVTVFTEKNAFLNKPCVVTEDPRPEAKRARAAAAEDQERAARFQKECQAYATDVLRQKLKTSYGAALDPSTVKIIDTDSRFIGFEYAWFQGSGLTASGARMTTTKMVQKDWSRYHCDQPKAAVAERDSKGTAGAATNGIR